MEKILLFLSLFLLIYACGKDSEAGPPPSSISSNNSTSTTELVDVRYDLYFRIFTILKKTLI
tara:strand:+ start:48 stop:233 length:186 start_codon:yes stop_codon:yes gene_type:complete